MGRASNPVGEQSGFGINTGNDPKNDPTPPGIPSPHSSGNHTALALWDLPPLPQKKSQNISTLCPIGKVPLRQPKQNVPTLFPQNCVRSFDSSSSCAGAAPSFAFGSIPLVL